MADRSVWRVRAVLVIGVVGFVVLFAVVRQVATSALRDQIDTTAEGRVVGLGLAIVPYALLVAALLLARRQRSAPIRSCTRN